jgi:hypothetical protein
VGAPRRLIAAAHHDHEALIPVEVLMRPRAMPDFKTRRFCVAVAATSS